MSEEMVKSVVKSIQNFTHDFHKTVAGKKDGNFVSSALSAHVVLSMAAYGARENTAKEMRKALYLPDDDTQGYQAFQNFIDILNNVPNVILKLANKIYASNSITVKDEFKQITSKHFHSESAVVDFSKKETTDLINQWCVDKTNSKIKEIVKAGELSDSTGMVLLNAVYFKGNWKDKFDKESTMPKPFHVNKTTTVDVPTMRIKKKFFFKDFEEINAFCIALPYENEDLSMVLVVPKEIDGLKNIEENLDKLNIDFKEELKYKEEVMLSLPKFKVETEIDLNLHLRDLGMVEMFTNGANFNGISDTAMKVDKVRQKAFIEVNEEGCEAAAVTGIHMMLCSMPLPPREVNVDKPFLYKIIHKNTILFSGRIVNPLLN